MLRYFWGGEDLQAFWSSEKHFSWVVGLSCHSFIDEFYKIQSCLLKFIRGALYTIWHHKNTAFAHKNSLKNLPFLNPSLEEATNFSLNCPCCLIEPLEIHDIETNFYNNSQLCHPCLKAKRGEALSGKVNLNDSVVCGAIQNFPETKVIWGWNDHPQETACSSSQEVGSGSRSEERQPWGHPRALRLWNWLLQWGGPGLVWGRRPRRQQVRPTDPVVTLSTSKAPQQLPRSPTLVFIDLEGTLIFNIWRMVVRCKLSG